jgi:hypothetical protein
MRKNRFVGPLTAVLFVIILLTGLGACGELDTVLSSGAVSYQVSALVGGSSLENSALVRKDDKISPYFVNSVADDPDVTGLRVTVKHTDGTSEIEILYTTGAEPGDTGESANDLEESGEFPRELFPEEFTGGLSLDPNFEGAETVPPEEAEFSVPKEKVPLPEEKSAGEQHIRVRRLDGDFPSFVLSETLPLGWYNLIFQVMKGKEVLSTKEKPFYYLGDANFSIDDIAGFLPGYGSHLAPPGIILMLEAQVSVDSRLDPYIVWYNGNRRLSEGRISAGANRIFWTAPNQTGFQTVRAEIFPFFPAQNTRIRGQIKELSIPVSSKGEAPGYFPRILDRETQEKIIHLYFFNGNLQDSKTAAALEPAPSTRRAPVWQSASGIYGLSLESGDVYTLPPTASRTEGEERSRLQFRFRFKPLGEGILFGAFLEESGDPSGGADLALRLEGGCVILAVHDRAGTQKAEIVREISGEDFISLLVDLSLRERELDLSIGEERGFPVKTDSGEIKSMVFTNPLNGKGIYRLGNRENTAAPVRPVITEENTETLSSPLAILDELALSFFAEAAADAGEEPSEQDDESGVQDPPEDKVNPATAGAQDRAASTTLFPAVNRAPAESKLDALRPESG